MQHVAILSRNLGKQNENDNPNLKHSFSTTASAAAGDDEARGGELVKGREAGVQRLAHAKGVGV